MKTNRQTMSASMAYRIEAVNGVSMKLRRCLNLLVAVSLFSGFLAGCDYYNDNKDEQAQFMRETNEFIKNAQEQNKKLLERVHQLELQSTKVGNEISKMGKDIADMKKLDGSLYISKEEFDYEDMQTMVIKITNHLWKVNRKRQAGTATTVKPEATRKQCLFCQGKGTLVERSAEPEFVKCTGCNGSGMLCQDTSKYRSTLYTGRDGYVRAVDGGWKMSANTKPCPMCSNKKGLNTAGTGMMRNPNYKVARKPCHHCNGTGYTQ